MTVASLFGSFTTVHALALIPLMAWGGYLCMQQWRHWNARRLLIQAGLAFSVAMVAQMPYWRHSAARSWEEVLILSLIFWTTAFLGLVTCANTIDAVVLAVGKIRSPGKRKRSATSKAALARPQHMQESRRWRAGSESGNGMQSRDEAIQPKVPEPENSAQWKDSSFSIRELDEGMIRSGAVLHFMYKQGQKEELFSIYRNDAWGNYRPEYGFRARLPFRPDGATKEVIQWRLRATQRMVSFLESEQRVLRLPGGVDLRDLQTFDGQRPNAIFW